MNTTIEEFIRAGNFPQDPAPIACLVNGQLRELTYHADRDLNVRVLTLADSEGMREGIKTETYIIDLTAPSASVSSLFSFSVSLSRIY